MSLNALARRKPKHLYDVQCGQAKARKIPFKLTFEEWENWWVESLGCDWITKRGCKKDQYVMARKGDEGGYELGNIECLTVTENYYNRKRHSRQKLTKEQVIYIRASKERSVILAKQFGILSTYVNEIRRRDCWKQLSADHSIP